MIPSNQRLAELKRLRLGVESVRHPLTQATILGTELKKGDLRWMAERSPWLTRAALEWASERRWSVGELLENLEEYILSKMATGRINLRTAAQYYESLRRELKELAKEGTEAGEHSKIMLLRKMATLTKSRRTEPAKEEEGERLLKELRGAPRAMAAAFLLTGARATEIMAIVPEDIQLKRKQKQTGVEDEAVEEVLIFLKGKNTTTAYLRPKRIRLETLDGVRLLAVKVLIAHATGRRTQGPIFSEKDAKTLWANMSPAQAKNAWRHGMATGTEKKIREEFREETLERLIRATVAAELRHKSLSSQNTYRLH